MFELFTPETKVQKDRQVMHDTDARVAKYSRRGLVLNFGVFSLALTFGDFFYQQTTLAIVLLTGLLLVTLLRSYYLFRFEVLYARAPRRWRIQYFLASFLGALWWSVILVSLTWTQGMREETLVMWLYTVVFYSSVANVFAPYFRFLKIYLFIGQVPAAVTALLLASVDSILYGMIMLLFYIMLVHQARSTSSIYWQRLEANYILRERARGLEFEQRNSRAAIELKNEFLVNLGHEFRASLNDILGTLSLVDDNQLADHQRELVAIAAKAGERQLDLVNNVVDFSKITTRTLALEESVFEVRRLVTRLVKDFALEAHQQGVELNYLLAADLPAQVKGDAARLRQIVDSLLAHAVKFSVTANVLIDVTYNSAEGEDGELQLVISDAHAQRSEESREADLAEQQAAHQAGHVGIGLAISKGLAECMGGSVHMRTTASGSNHILINIPLLVMDHPSRQLGADRRLEDKQVLLVNLPDRVALALASEMVNWGIHTSIVYGHGQALEKVRTLHEQGQKINIILINNRLSDFDALVLSGELSTTTIVAETPQLLVISPLQRDAEEVREHLANHPHVGCIEKPLIYAQLYDTLCQRLLGDALGEERLQDASNIQGEAMASDSRRVLVVENHRVNQMVASGMLKKLDCFVQLVASGPEAVAVLEQDDFDLVLLDYELPEDQARLALEQIRSLEKAQKQPRPLPVVAMVPMLKEGEAGQWLAMGYSDYINKPLRYDELEIRIQRWLGI